jgi:hypothetical protein
LQCARCLARFVPRARGSRVSSRCHACHVTVRGVCVSSLPTTARHVPSPAECIQGRCALKLCESSLQPTTARHVLSLSLQKARYAYDLAEPETTGVGDDRGGEGEGGLGKAGVRRERSTFVSLPCKPTADTCSSLSLQKGRYQGRCALSRERRGGAGRRRSQRSQRDLKGISREREGLVS